MYKLVRNTIIKYCVKLTPGIYCVKFTHIFHFRFSINYLLSTNAVNSKTNINNFMADVLRVFSLDLILRRPLCLSSNAGLFILLWEIYRTRVKIQFLSILSIKKIIPGNFIALFTNKGYCSFWKKYKYKNQHWPTPSCLHSYSGRRL